MVELTDPQTTDASAGSSCCSTEAQADCCEPSDKADCCEPESSSCGGAFLHQSLCKIPDRNRKSVHN
jgi:hypothetical protein